MAAPMKYNPEFHDKWAWSLAIRGATDKEIADAFGVSERTVNRWKYKNGPDGKPIKDTDGEKVLSDFGKLLQTGKDAADAQVEYSLFERCIGYTATDEEKILEYNPDGSVKPIKVRTVKRKIAPDVMAQMYWLNNRSRKTGDWTQKQVVTFDGTVDFQSQMKSIADLINNPVENRELTDDTQGNCTKTSDGADV